jgi:hypothetical protein
LTNVDGTNDADGTVTWTDSSTGLVTHVVKTTTVPADAALSVIATKLVLEAGDSIGAFASAAGDLEISISVVELS